MDEENIFQFTLTTSSKGDSNHMVQIVNPVVAWHTVKDCVIVHILGPRTGSEMDSRADIEFFCHLNPGNVVAKF